MAHEIHGEASASAHSQVGRVLRRRDLRCHKVLIEQLGGTLRIRLLSGFTNVKAIDLLDRSKCWSEYFGERRAAREIRETAGGGSSRTGPSRARLCARQYK